MPFSKSWAIPWLVAALALAASAASSAQTGPPATGAVDTALAYIQANPGSVGATPADVAELAVTSAYRSAHNGVTHVNVQQHFEGLPLGGAHATVNVGADGSVVFVGGVFRADLAEDEDATVRLDALGAVEAAADALDLGQPRHLRVVELSVADGQESVLSDGGISEQPIPARIVWYDTPRGLRLAWEVEIDDASGVSYWTATVDAASGALLDVEDLTIEDEHEDLTSTLDRGVNATSTSLTSEAGTNNPVDDGSSYNVFEIPTESPNDGPRAVVSNPADATASPFGWHDTDGVTGAEFTSTRGNNAHAYLDQDNNNQPDFAGSPDGGAGLDFDFPVDLSEHAQAYREAVVTNLFYWNNVIHDLTYLYGFTEDAGNFQAKNYVGGPTAGNGEGDYVRAEAADGGGTNNANFNTGASRMQMYLWPGSTNAFGFQNEVVVDGLGSFVSSWARFGPPAVNAGTSGAFVDGGTGCLVTDYAPPAGDWIAVATGGNSGCQNIDKARVADAAGANAIVLVNTSSSSTPPVLTGSQVLAPPTIPAASVNQADGNTIRAAIAAGATTGTVRKDPDHPGIRDGDLENGIIVHEYGHGISIRTTGGPLVSCLSGNEQAGEGWSDYLAIAMLLNPALDDPEGPRGMGPYALFQGSRQGNGIRPRPYSRNMAIQPFTYDSIKTGGWLPNSSGTAGTSLALPHGLGHGWAATLWDVTWELIDKHGFNPNIYDAWDTGGNNRAFQYVLDGLKIQGCAPTLLRSARAVITAADVLDGGADYCTVYAAFARRGFGYSAVDGTTNRNDNDEAFDTDPECRRGFLSPVTAPYGTLTTVEAGSTVPLKFTAPELSGTDILATNNPYSRLVDCETLRTVDTSYPFVTPRPIPVPTASPGNSKLSVNSNGQYHYNWKTLGEWAGTCREVVVTRDDGIQHRAFFRFTGA